MLANDHCHCEHIHQQSINRKGENLMLMSFQDLQTVTLVQLNLLSQLTVFLANVLKRNRKEIRLELSDSKL